MTARRRDRRTYERQRLFAKSAAVHAAAFRRRLKLRRLVGFALPSMAIGVALIGGAVMLAVVGVNPLAAYRALFDGAFGGINELANSALRAIPLMCVGAGICVAFRANLINIGGEGQLIFGAIFGVTVALTFASVPRVFLVPAVLIAGAIGGGIWGLIPGIFNAYRNVSIVLSTVMFNLVAAQFLTFLLNDWLRDPNSLLTQQTQRLPESSDLPILPGGTRLHVGIFVGVAVCFATYVLLFRTAMGVRLRAVGANSEAALYAGMPIRRGVMEAMFVSGACCGIGGAMLVIGSESHRLIAEVGLATTFTENAGFNGIVTGLLAGLNPLVAIASSFLFGGLLSGSLDMQRVAGVPGGVVVALNGLILLFLVSSLRASRRLRRWSEQVIDDGDDESDHERQPASDDQPSAAVRLTS